MERRISTVLCCVFLMLWVCVTAGTAEAAGGSCGKDLKWTLEDGVLTVSGTGDMKDYERRRTPWYGRVEEVRAIVVEEGVTGIGEYAFFRCEAETVTLPDTLKRLGSNAFRECTSLKEVVVPESVEKMRGSVFLDCEALRTVKLPSSLTRIPSKTFRGCKLLKEVEIPSGVTAIGDSAFSSCEALEQLELPAGLTSIGAWGFSNCVALEGLTIPEGVTEIGKAAFAGCDFVSFRLPEGVKTVSSRLFANCSKLKEVDLPDSVTLIADEAFYCCSSLERIYIPKSVAQIDGTAFSECYSFIAYEVDPQNPWYGSDGSGALLSSDLTELIVAPPYIDGGIFRVSEGVLKIGKQAFKDRRSLKEILLPEGLEEIGDEAFADCVNLRQIHLPATMRTVGRWAFVNCEELKLISVCNDLVELDLDAVSGLEGTKLYHPEGTDWNPNNYDGWLDMVSYELPKIITQPTDVAVPGGQWATVLADAEGRALGYRWYRAEAGSKEFKKIEGVAGLQYAVLMDSSHHGSRVYYEAVDEFGNIARSDTVTLTDTTHREPELPQQSKGIRLWQILAVAVLGLAAAAAAVAMFLKWRSGKNT